MNHKGTEDTETLQEKMDDFVHDVRNGLRRWRRNIRYKRRIFQNRLFGKTYHITLKEILETGKFGGLQSGMIAEYAACAMGEPDWGREKLRDSEFEFWSYGDTEVFFYKEYQTLYYFKIPLQHNFRFPVNVVVEGYFPKSGTTLAEFEEYLKREAIDYVVLWESFGYDRWPVVYTSSGAVSTRFGEDTLEIIGIYAHDDLSSYEWSCLNQIKINMLDLLQEYVNRTGTGFVLPNKDYLMNETYSSWEERKKITMKPTISYVYEADDIEVNDFIKPISGKLDLIVELVLAHTKEQELRSNIRRYLNKGTKQVWVIYPETKEVFQHIAGEQEQLINYKGSQTIDAEDLFPGIEGLTTDNIFKLPKWAMQDEGEDT